MRHLSGLADIAASYDGFIVDLWGVVHDGFQPHHGAIFCLEQLQRAGARVLLLSNAPRRAHVTGSGLGAMGIAAHHYMDILTSGEATWRELGDRPGLRVFHLGPERDLSLLEARDVRLVRDPASADLLLNTGPDDSRDPTTIDPFLPELRAGLSAGLPMLCANPDLEVLRGSVRVVCAGALAQWYENAGGTVQWIGKPFPEIYQTALARLDVPRHRVLAVGDSLRTDIAGAATAGIDACWILSGIHGHETVNSAEAEAAAAGLKPAYALSRFVWESVARDHA